MGTESAISGHSNSDLLLPAADDADPEVREAQLCGWRSIVITGEDTRTLS